MYEKVDSTLRNADSTLGNDVLHMNSDLRVQNNTAMHNFPHMAGNYSMGQPGVSNFNGNNDNEQRYQPASPQRGVHDTSLKPGPLLYASTSVHGQNKRGFETFHSNDTHQVMSSQFGEQWNVPPPKCNCHLTASVAQVKKPTINQGRYFYRCHNWNSQGHDCGFFLWVDKHESMFQTEHPNDYEFYRQQAGRYLPNSSNDSSFGINI